MHIDRYRISRRLRSVALTVEMTPTGRLCLRAEVFVTAELFGEFSNVQPADDGSVTLSISASLTDVSGQTVTGTATAVVIDDAAIAVADADSTESGVATGHVLTGIDTVGGDANLTDGTADIPGADGFAATTVVGVATTDTEVSDGMRVRYYPSPSMWFVGEVDGEPWQLGHGTWVVRLKNMLVDYATRTGKSPGRNWVNAASLECCEPHEEACDD